MTSEDRLERAFPGTRVRLPHARAGDVDLLTFFRFEVRPRLQLNDVFGELLNTRASGDIIRCACPLHLGQNRSFAINRKDLTWTCHSKCQRGGGPLEFVHLRKGGTGKLRGREFVSVVLELAAKVGLAADMVQSPARGCDEAESIWKSSLAVTDDLEVARWFADERGLDPRLVATADVARVLHPRADLPRWAGFERDGWRSWPSVGYRIVTPLFNAHGRIRSLRFRNPRRDTKGRSASGHSSVGLVMADDVARTVLERRQQPAWWGSEVFATVVAEGEPDFWSWSTEAARRGLGDRASSFPAVIGVVSGSFDRSIASRLPRGSRVVSAMHDDRGGDNIHERMRRDLTAVNRGISLSRWRAP